MDGPFEAARKEREGELGRHLWVTWYPFLAKIAVRRARRQQNVEPSRAFIGSGCLRLQLLLLSVAVVGKERPSD